MATYVTKAEARKIAQEEFARLVKQLPPGERGPPGKPGDRGPEGPPGKDGTSSPTPAPTPSPPPQRYFSASSFWNRRLADDVPLAPRSSEYVAALTTLVQSSSHPKVNHDDYSTPVYTVPAGQPTVSVSVRDYYGRNDPWFVGACKAVPIPPGARPAAGTDGHMVIVQGDRMWEFWVMRQEAGQWVCAYGGYVDNLDSNIGRMRMRGEGATATGLPLLGGLITLKELEANEIPHALCMAIPGAGKNSVYPAWQSDGQNAAGIPEGTTFRLPASLDIASLGLSRPVDAMALAVQRYGLILRDQSGIVSLYGEDPTPSGSQLYAQLLGTEPEETAKLRKFPWSALQVITPAA